MGSSRDGAKGGPQSRGTETRESRCRPAELPNPAGVTMDSGLATAKSRQEAMAALPYSHHHHRVLGTSSPRTRRGARSARSSRLHRQSPATPCGAAGSRRDNPGSWPLLRADAEGKPAPGAERAHRVRQRSSVPRTPAADTTPRFETAPSGECALPSANRGVVARQSATRALVGVLRRPRATGTRRSGSRTPRWRRLPEDGRARAGPVGQLARGPRARSRMSSVASRLERSPVQKERIQPGTRRVFPPSS